MDVFSLLKIALKIKDAIIYIIKFIISKIKLFFHGDDKTKSRRKIAFAIIIVLLVVLIVDKTWKKVPVNTGDKGTTIIIGRDDVKIFKNGSKKPEVLKKPVDGKVEMRDGQLHIQRFGLGITPAVGLGYSNLAFKPTLNVRLLYYCAVEAGVGIHDHKKPTLHIFIAYRIPKIHNVSIFVGKSMTETIPGFHVSLF